MFNWFKKAKTAIISSSKAEPQDILSKEEAMKLQYEVHINARALAALKPIQEDLATLIKERIQNGKKDTKYFLVSKDFEMAAYRSKSHEFQGYSLIYNEALSIAQKHFKDLLNKLGYEVIVRPFSVAVTSVHGPVNTYFAGYELHIIWG